VVKNEDSTARTKLIQILGGKCAHCPDTRLLEIDHKYNNGAYERKYKFNSEARMYKYYVDNPEEAKHSLQDLCPTCHRIETNEKKAKIFPIHAELCWLYYYCNSCDFRIRVTSEHPKLCPECGAKNCFSEPDTRLLNRGYMPDHPFYEMVYAEHWSMEEGFTMYDDYECQCENCRIILCNLSTLSSIRAIPFQ
jgi:hypothetical protein